MTVKLLVEARGKAGTIKRYRTDYTGLVGSTDRDGGVANNPDTRNACGERNCQRLACALYAARRHDGDPSLAAMIGPLIFVSLLLALFGMPLIVTVVASVVIYCLYQRGFEKDRKTSFEELTEFREKGTVNGLRARQVYGNDPRRFFGFILLFGFPYSYFVWNVLHITGNAYHVVFLLPMTFLIYADPHLAKIREKYVNWEEYAAAYPDEARRSTDPPETSGGKN